MVYRSACSHQHHVAIIGQLWKAGLLCKNRGKKTAVYMNQWSVYEQLLIEAKKYSRYTGSQ